MNRKIISRLHPIAGAIALLTILTFWTATIVSKLSGDVSLILGVKTFILYGMIILIPSMIAVGVSGFKLGHQSKNPKVIAKKKRMPIIALNGICILMPSAIVLYLHASAGNYNHTFDIIQGIELVAGALNIVLLGMSARDGLILTKRFERTK